MASALKLVGWLLSALLALGVAGCGWLLLDQTLSATVDEGWLTILLAPLVSLVVLYWAATTIHEVGHLVAAWSAGLYVLQVWIGPLKWARAKGVLRAGWNRSGYRIAGGVEAVPRDDRDLERRMAVFIAGGPLANLVVGLVLLAAVWLVGGPPERSILFLQVDVRTELDAAWWLQGAALWNGISFLLNCIPLQVQGVPSDGAKLAGWLSNSVTGQRSGLTLLLQASLMAGVRPREWNLSLVERLLVLREQTDQDVNANVFGYYFFLDSGNLPRAGEHLTAAIHQSKCFAPGFRTGTWLEGAYFYAFHSGNLGDALTCFAEAKGGDVEKQTWLRAEAAIEFARGRYAEAIAHAEAALAVAPFSWDPGGTLAEIDWIQEILDASRQHLTVEALPAEAKPTGFEM